MEPHLTHGRCGFAVLPSRAKDRLWQGARPNRSWHCNLYFNPTHDRERQICPLQTEIWQTLCQCSECLFSAPDCMRGLKSQCKLQSALSVHSGAKRATSLPVICQHQLTQKLVHCSQLCLCRAEATTSFQNQEAHIRRQAPDWTGTLNEPIKDSRTGSQVCVSICWQRACTR